MTRSRSALVGLAVVALAVTGCSGRQRDATQSSVAGDVEERLLEDGYVAARGEDAIEVDAADADAVGNCVAREMFEDTETWTKDERNAATQTNDGDEPDPDLVLKVEDLVNQCYDDVVGGGGSSGSDDDGEEQTSSDDEGSTTTTEG